MEGEEPEQGGSPEENSPPESSVKSKSKSPTPGVLGSQKSRSKSPTPEVTEPQKSTRSPIPQVFTFDHAMKLPTPEIPHLVLKTDKSITSDVSDPIQPKTKSPTPEHSQNVSLKSESKTSTQSPSSSSGIKTSRTAVNIVDYPGTASTETKFYNPGSTAPDISPTHSLQTQAPPALASMPLSKTSMLHQTPHRSKSPSPDILNRTLQTTKSIVSQTPPSSSTKPSGSEVFKFMLQMSASIIPEIPQSTRSKSPSPDAIRFTPQNTKSTSPEQAQPWISRSPSPQILPHFIAKSKSTEDSTEVQALSSDIKSPQVPLSATSSALKTVRISSVDIPKGPYPSEFQSKSTQTTDEFPPLDFDSASNQTASGVDSSLSRPDLTDSVPLKSKNSIPENSNLRKSKSKLLVREVSFAESYKTEIGEKSQMTELRTSILSGGTTSTTNSATAKVASDGHSGPGFRGGSLAVFHGAGPGILQSGNIQGFASSLLQKRSPFIHNPPQPEERRQRIASPRTPKEYIINLREDLADFQESHGLPRTRDYSFVSLGLALAQETCRAIYSLFQMFAELFPILAIVSLIVRFALDKIIEILETTETMPKIKKSVLFALEMMAIVIPLWILIGTIIIPLLSLILTMLKKVLRFRGGKKKSTAKLKMKPPAKGETCTSTSN